MVSHGFPMIYVSDHFFFHDPLTGIPFVKGIVADRLPASLVARLAALGVICDDLDDDAISQQTRPSYADAQREWELSMVARYSMKMPLTEAAENVEYMSEFLCWALVILDGSKQWVVADDVEGIKKSELHWGKPNGEKVKYGDCEILEVHACFDDDDALYDDDALDDEAFDFDDDEHL